MSHIPQCDCSQCITYRLHADRKERDEIVANAFMESVKEAVTLPKISIQRKQETVPPETDYELSKDALIAHLTEGMKFDGDKLMEGYKLVEKRATRKWRDEHTVAMELGKLGLTQDELFAPRPAQPPAHRYAQFYALLEEVKALHDSKGSDYEGEGKSYCNLRGPEEWGVPAWVYAMTRCEEKMRRIKTFAKGSTLKHEGARDSLMDIAVLSLIAIVLMEEKE